MPRKPVYQKEIELRLNAIISFGKGTEGQTRVGRRQAGQIIETMANEIKEILKQKRTPKELRDKWYSGND